MDGKDGWSGVWESGEVEGKGWKRWAVRRTGKGREVEGR